MITEDYVSFDTAKLLKEKGFNEPCLKQYYKNGSLSDVSIEARYNTIDNQVSAPTLQTAMKWLREVHNIVVEPFIREDTKYVWYVHRIEVKFNKKYLIFSWGSKNVKYEQYEEACEAAIKYCLENLI